MPRGRPKSPNPPRVRTFRATDEYWQRVRDAAVAEGLTAQAFILDALDRRIALGRYNIAAPASERPPSE